MRKSDPPNGSNATRDRILAAAATILTQRGYAGTRLADIATLADLRAPALYYYFGSRDELITEVMVAGQRWLRNHVADTLSALPPDTPTLDRICTAIEAHLRTELGLSEFATAVTRNSGQLPEPIRSALSHESAKYHTLWRLLLKAGQADGSVRSDVNVATIRMLTMGALNWIPEWWDPSTASIEAVVDTAQSLIRSGIANVESSPLPPHVTNPT